MRNAILAGLAIVALIAAIFAATQFRVATTTAIHHNLSASEAAQLFKPGYTGTQRIGAWTATCAKPKIIPAWAKSLIAPAGGHLPPPPKYPHCHLNTRLTNPADPSRWADMIVATIGKTDILNTFWKITPGVVNINDFMDLIVDGKVIKVKVLICGRTECVAVPTARGQDLAKMTQTAGQQIVAAKSAVLVFPAYDNLKPLQLRIPTENLQLAVAAIGRVQPINARTMHEN